MQRQGISTKVSLFPIRCFPVPSVSSVLLTFGIFAFHEDFHRFPFAPELALCSRLFSGFDFVLAFDFVFPPYFLRDSVPPCCKPAVVGLRGEYWVLVVASPRCANLWRNVLTFVSFVVGSFPDIWLLTSPPSSSCVLKWLTRFPQFFS